MTSTDRPRRRHGLRGWGGVGAMAAACVLTATLTLLQLSGTGAGNDPAQQAQQARRTATALPAAAETCVRPEASLRPSDQAGPTIAKIKARGILIVGIDQNSYRWGYRNPATGTIEGFDIDLAHAIAKNILGDPDRIRFLAIPTNLRIEALKKSTVDLVVRTMTINCDRIKDVDFSTAYFQAGQQVLAPRGSTITGYDTSLKGKRVCTAQGSTAYEKLEQQSYGAVFRDTDGAKAGGSGRLTVPNQLDCLVRLQLGEVDAVVTDNALAAGQAAQDPSVALKGEPFTKEFYGVAVRRGNEDLVRRINQVLVEYRSGGQNSPWMASYDKWLRAGLPGITGPPEPQYKDN